jgi:prepilin-type processing-associated H-X9-DG protein
MGTPGVSDSHITANTSCDPWAEAAETASDTYHGTSWILRMLPYIEGTTTAKAWNYHQSVGGTALVNGLCNATLAQMDQKGFYCPSRRSQLRAGVDTAMMQTTITPAWAGGGTDYGGCAGRGVVFAGRIGGGLPLALPDATNHLTTAVCPGVTFPNTQYVVTGEPAAGTGAAAAEKAFGILGQMNQSASFASIRDGTSNTIMTGEVQRITSTTSATPYTTTTGPILSKDGWAIGGIPTLFTTGWSPAGALMNNGLAPSPGSEHSNGANFGLGDGSVRFLNSSIDANIFLLAGSMADRVAIGFVD